MSERREFVSRERAPPAPTLPGACETPRIVVRGRWRTPTGWSWADSHEMPPGHHSGNQTWFHSGLIRTDAVRIVNTGVSLACLAGRCEACPSAIEVDVGYDAKEVLVHRDFAFDECHAWHVFDHELRHGEVFRRQEEWAVREARAALEAAFSRVDPHVVPDGADQRAVEYWSRRAAEIVHPIHDEMVAGAARGNAPLDTLSNYEAEQRAAEAECGVFRRDR